MEQKRIDFIVALQFSSSVGNKRNGKLINIIDRLCIKAEQMHFQPVFV